MEREEIERIVRQQEREAPPVRPFDNYISLFSQKDLTEGRKLYMGGHVQSPKRLGRWIWAQVGRFIPLVVLDRKGSINWMTCTCRPHQTTVVCPHEVALLETWANTPQHFSVLHSPPLARSLNVLVPKSKSITLYDNYPSIEHLVREFSDFMEREYRLTELRSSARKLKVKRSSQRKADIAEAVARVLLEGDGIRHFSSDLPRESLLLLSLTSLFVSKAFRRTPLSSFGSKLYALFDPEIEVKAAWDALLDSGAELYLEFGIPVYLVRPEWRDTVQLPLATDPTSREPTISRPFAEVRRLFLHLVEQFSTHAYSGPQLNIPLNMDEDRILRQPSFWHPEWILVPTAFTLQPLFLHTWLLPARETRRLSGSLDVPEEMIRALHQAAVALSILYTEAGRGTWKVSEADLRRFLQAPYSVQLRILASVLIYKAAYLAAIRQQQRKAQRFLAPVRYGLFRSLSQTGLMIDALLRDILVIFSMSEENSWIPWNEVKRMYAPWQEREVPQEFLYGFATDPLSDWPDFLDHWLHDAFLYLGNWGLLDLVLDQGHITHVRHRYLYTLLQMTSAPVQIPDMSRIDAAQLDVVQHRHTLRLFFPLGAPQELLQLASSWGSEAEFSRGKLKVTLTPRTVVAAFSAGKTPESMAEEWERIAGFPLPARIAEYLQQAYDVFGSVRIYPGVAVIRFQDGMTRRHLEAALPELQKAIRAVVDERTLLVDESQLKTLSRALEKSGYAPRWTRMEEKR